ncbi:hypothetical protein BU17DRAFT_70851 [Hysterangium stoloniferum]|nr:hypothetical protein BU17DRAFT_70851 [Hysterangium stoloniferum]
MPTLPPPILTPANAHLPNLSPSVRSLFPALSATTPPTVHTGEDPAVLTLTLLADTLMQQAQIMLGTREKRYGLLPLWFVDRIPIHNSSSVFKVSLLQVKKDRGTVEVLWDGGQKQIATNPVPLKPTPKYVAWTSSTVRCGPPAMLSAPIYDTSLAELFSLQTQLFQQLQQLGPEHRDQVWYQGMSQFRVAPQPTTGSDTASTPSTSTAASTTAAVSNPMTIEDPISPSPEDGLNALLDGAIEHFGYAAGDVFHAIYHFDSMTEDHKKAFQISHQALQETTAVLAPGNIVLNSRVSHRILVIHPIPCEYLEADYWALNFKSSWIGRSMLKQLHIAGDINICQTINMLRQRPQTAALAVWYFEPLAHCRLTAGSTGGFWPLVTMTSNGADPPEVISDPSISIPNNVKFAQVQRKVVKFQSTADLPTCFKEHEYYQPVTPNFPLFDAFTVDLYPSRHSAILWILQMTMFRSHGGSAPTVSEPLVEVRYLLISPRAQNDPVQPTKTWRFPKGWNENCKMYDHRGDVYWLEIIFTMICFCTVSSPASQPVQNEFHELASKSGSQCLPSSKYQIEAPKTTCKDQQTMIRYYYNIIRVHMAVGELEQFGGQGAEVRDLILSMLD